MKMNPKFVLDEGVEGLPNLTKNDKSSNKDDLDSSNKTDQSDVTAVSSHQEEKKRKLAATRDNANSMLVEDNDESLDCDIEALRMLPSALNDDMFDSDIFGDLEEL